MTANIIEKKRTGKETQIQEEDLTTNNKRERKRTEEEDIDRKRTETSSDDRKGKENSTTKI